MPEKIKSISARQLSEEVQTAVKKALANNAALKGIPPEPKFVISPWLIGFILRELENKTLHDAQGLAKDVVAHLPSAKGETPATLIHDGHIILSASSRRSFSNCKFKRDAAPIGRGAALPERPTGDGGRPNSRGDLRRDGSVACHIPE